MRTFVENLIPEHQNVRFVKTAFSDAGRYQIASSVILLTLSLLEHILGPSFTQGPTKVDAGHTHTLKELVN